MRQGSLLPEPRGILFESWGNYLLVPRKREVPWFVGGPQPCRPSCGSLDAYEARRPNGALRFRCKGCKKDFTITSGTLFASHKLPLRGYLAAIAVFCNEVKGKSALALSRDLGL